MYNQVLFALYKVLTKYPIFPHGYLKNYVKKHYKKAYKYDSSLYCLFSYYQCIISLFPDELLLVD